MSVIQSNISTTIRSFNISDDIRIEVKKFRTEAAIEKLDIDDDDDDISVIQRIHKTFAEGTCMIEDRNNLKKIIQRLEDIEKKLENIIYMNAQADSLSNENIHITPINGLNGDVEAQIPTTQIISVQHPIPQADNHSSVENNTVEYNEDEEEEEEEAEGFIEEIIDNIEGEDDEESLKLVEFPINNLDDLKELEESILNDQESFRSFLTFLTAAVDKNNRVLENILQEFVTDNVLSEMADDDSIMSFYIFHQLLYDLWKVDSSTMEEYENLLKREVVRATQSKTIKIRKNPGGSRTST